MSTLADPRMRELLCQRLASVRPASARQWGLMTPHEMICHLNDSFRVATGEKYASPDTNLFKRTVFKWVGLHTSLPWPKGLPTRPELLQGKGGTPPADWERDCAELAQGIHAFAGRTTYAAHPMFGEMSKADWLIWGYRHVDHHLRQFGV